MLTGDGFCREKRQTVWFCALKQKANSALTAAFCGLGWF
jgi:hypothetical protein